MKKTVYLVIVAFLLVAGIPVSGSAAPIVNEVGWIVGIDTIDIEFNVDAEQIYTATLSDLSWATNYTGFSLLTLSISTATEILAELTIIDLNDPVLTAQTGTNTYGSVDFEVKDATETLYASILGQGSGTFERGKYGLEIVASSIPIPATMLLLGSGLVALTTMKRRK